MVLGVRLFETAFSAGLGYDMGDKSKCKDTPFFWGLPVPNAVQGSFLACGQSHTHITSLTLIAELGKNRSMQNCVPSTFHPAHQPCSFKQ